MVARGGGGRAPERISSPHLLLRPWTAEDVDALLEAITSSLEHLRAWLAWAVHEPESRSAKLERIRQNAEAFASGERYTYGIFERETGRVLGAVACEPVTDGAGETADLGFAREIGYWLRADATGRGLCTEAVGAVSRMGFDDLGLGHLEIQCDPRNRPSARVPERLGYRLVETRSANKLAPDGRPRDTQVWVLRAGARGALDQ